MRLISVAFINKHLFLENSLILSLMEKPNGESENSFCMKFNRMFLIQLNGTSKHQASISL